MSLLENYYDRRWCHEFDTVFAGTDIGRNPAADEYDYFANVEPAQHGAEAYESLRPRRRLLPQPLLPQPLRHPQGRRRPQLWNLGRELDCALRLDLMRASGRRPLDSARQPVAPVPWAVGERLSGGIDEPTHGGLIQSQTDGEFALGNPLPPQSPLLEGFTAEVSPRVRRTASPSESASHLIPYGGHTAVRSTDANTVPCEKLIAS